jgi:hypothetical protein
MEEAVAFAFLDAPEETSAPEDAAGPSREPPAPCDPPPLPEAEKSNGQAVEIRITLDKDDRRLLDILSAIDPNHRAPAPVPAQPLELRAPARDAGVAPHRRARDGARSWISPLALLLALLLGFALRPLLGALRLPQAPADSVASVKQTIDRIFAVESQGDAAARNPHSSALGVGQFVDATWLDLIRRHRPDIATSLSEKAILDLRKDPDLSRFMASRYAEQNTSLLAKRGLPVTPGSLYLAHFAGPAGAAAILSAPETADAASVIANADARLTREKIVTGNPFMKNFTAKDLKNWADLKMQGLTLASGGR